MSIDHISNREELINFIKADTVGPIKDTTSLSSQVFKRSSSKSVLSEIFSFSCSNEN